tara:strand:- start:7765 stop:8529 length:765 start_codon:yes stop_codon:yes gene_type:complete
MYIGSMCAYNNGKSCEGKVTSRPSPWNKISSYDLFHATQSFHEDGVFVTGKYIPDKTKCTLLEYLSVALEHSTHVMCPREQMEFIQQTYINMTTGIVDSYIINYLYALSSPKCPETLRIGYDDLDCIREIVIVYKKYINKPLPAAIRHALKITCDKVVTSRYKTDTIAARKRDLDLAEYKKKMDSERLKRQAAHASYVSDIKYTDTVNANFKESELVFARCEGVHIAARTQQVVESEYNDKIWLFNGTVDHGIK